MKKSLYSVAGLLAFGLAIGALVAPDADAKGENVTFSNQGSRKVFVLATHGGDKCSEMSEQVNFELEPDADYVVESGASKVCYCVGMRNKVSSCGEGAWQVARPGKTERLNL